MAMVRSGVRRVDLCARWLGGMDRTKLGSVLEDMALSSDQVLPHVGVRRSGFTSAISNTSKDRREGICSWFVGGNRSRCFSTFTDKTPLALAGHGLHAKTKFRIEKQLTPVMAKVKRDQAVHSHTPDICQCEIAATFPLRLHLVL